MALHRQGEQEGICPLTENFSHFSGRLEGVLGVPWNLASNKEIDYGK